MIDLIRLIEGTYQNNIEPSLRIKLVKILCDTFTMKPEKAMNLINTIDTREIDQMIALCGYLTYLEIKSKSPLAQPFMVNLETNIVRMLD